MIEKARPHSMTRRARLLLSMLMVGVVVVTIPLTPIVWKWATVTDEKGIASITLTGSGLSGAWATKLMINDQNLFIARWMKMKSTTPGSYELHIQSEVKRWGPHAGRGHGKYLESYKGRKVAEGTIRDGRMHELWSFWDPATGQLLMQERYRKGELEDSKNSSPWWNGVKDQ